MTYNRLCCQKESPSYVKGGSFWCQKDQGTVAGNGNQLQIMLFGKGVIGIADRVKAVKQGHAVPLFHHVADGLDQAGFLKWVLAGCGRFFLLEFKKMVHEVKWIGAGNGKVVLVAEHGRNVVDGFQFRGNLPGGFKKQFTFIGEAYTAVLPAEDGKSQFLLQGLICLLTACWDTNRFLAVLV